MKAIEIYYRIPKKIRDKIIGVCEFDEYDECNECGIGPCRKGSRAVRDCEIEQIRNYLVWSNEIPEFMDEKIIKYIRR